MTTTATTTTATTTTTTTTRARLGKLLRTREKVGHHCTHAALKDDLRLRLVVSRREVDERLGGGEQQRVVVGAHAINQRLQHAVADECVTVGLEDGHRGDLPKMEGGAHEEEEEDDDDDVDDEEEAEEEENDDDGGRRGD